MRKKPISSILTLAKLKPITTGFLCTLLSSCGVRQLSEPRYIATRAAIVEEFRDLFRAPIHQVSAGGSNSCAVDNLGVKCWGSNSSGQTNVPKGLKNPNAVSAGGAHTCAIEDDGIKCWGSSEYGELKVPHGLKKSKVVSAGDLHTCAIDDEGVKCWGDNYFGQSNVPRDLANPIVVSAGGQHTCAIGEKGVQCWGNNNYGQADVVDSLENPKAVSAGRVHSCAIDDEGVKCWGNNNFGQTRVPQGLKNPKVVSAGSDHSCAIDNEGVKCWGSNNNGQTDVPQGLKNPKSVSTGSWHTCAIDDEGVKCWGSNHIGQTIVADQVPMPGVFFHWPQILCQFMTADKSQLFQLIQNSVFAKLPQPAKIDSKEHQLLVHLMTRYISEFPSDYFRQNISPKWQKSLDILVTKTGIKTAADIPQTPATLVVAVKLLNAAFVAVKPMLSGPEQREVEEIILMINACLAGEMTLASAQNLVKEIRKHNTLMNAIAASDVVHLTSVVVDDAMKWIMEGQ